MRLHPWPSDGELRTYYPDEYWFAPAGGAVGHLEELYRRLVLCDHIRFVEAAIQHAGAGGLVLDVGCGGGLLAGMLAERGVRVAGLDSSLNAARIAWHRKGAPAVCGDLASAPFARESCAVITMFHVVEHLYDPGAYLAAAHELLKPDGRLVVQAPNAACWQFRLFGERWNGLDAPRHLIDFRQSDLDRLLARCGFEPVRHKYFSLRDNPAGLATTLAPSLDPMARRVRQAEESGAARLFKNLAYLALAMASVPFAAIEAAFRAGSTVMVEARKKR
jgi:SAM-dependent methyltransferase